ncbi:MAG: hypothetical protein A3E70_03050 [Candidatus Levybacteria bacterium RIFCSPHIGHO2_12_FULL_40_44]|nr:MAG: hypothetical protein A3E70_03050 [Candidatus Levybacteria bacterium RIFCSPHIGHO2_12_FULL_40_44]
MLVEPEPRTEPKTPTREVVRVGQNLATRFTGGAGIDLAGQLGDFSAVYTASYPKQVFRRISPDGTVVQVKFNGPGMEVSEEKINLGDNSFFGSQDGVDEVIVVWSSQTANNAPQAATAAWIEEMLAQSKQQTS